MGKSTLKTPLEPNLNDLQLIELYLSSRNPLYFNNLYDRYKTKVYGKCISLLKNEANAQDALQEIFLKIFLNLSKFGEESKFSTWVYSITYNYCIDLLRKKKKDKQLFTDEMETDPEAVEDVPDTLLLEIEVSQLKVTLDSLPVGDKAILLMKYQDELKIRDIAEILDKSESAIKMKLKRAKIKAKCMHTELFPNI